jgi:hypothetical protein
MNLNGLYCCNLWPHTRTPPSRNLSQQNYFSCNACVRWSWFAFAGLRNTYSRLNDKDAINDDTSVSVHPSAKTRSGLSLPPADSSLHQGSARNELITSDLKLGKNSTISTGASTSIHNTMTTEPKLPSSLIDRGLVGYRQHTNSALPADCSVPHQPRLYKLRYALPHARVGEWTLYSSFR